MRCSSNSFKTNAMSIINKYFFAKRQNKFQGKIIIITGSSKGIGKATALEFLKVGANVVINGRDPVVLRKTANEFEQLGFSPFEIVGDMSDFKDCQYLVQKTIEHFGKIDVLVNNAGGGFRGKIENTAPETMKKVIDSNLMTAIYCTQAALKYIKLSKGSLIFISSIAGIRGLPNNGPYCIAKMGLNAFAQTLKLELNRTGVHIGILLVGLTDYDLDKKVISDDGSLISINRKSHQTKEQVSKKIMFLIKKRKSYLILTKLGKMNAFFQKISPSFVEWIILHSNQTDGFNN